MNWINEIKEGNILIYLGSGKDANFKHKTTQSTTTLKFDLGVLGISLPRTCVVNHIQNNLIDGMGVEKFDRIPLTPAIFKNCGFVSPCRDTYELSSITFKEDVKYRGVYFYYDGSNVIHVQYLHQLQNLYKDVTGKDLNVDIRAITLNPIPPDVQECIECTQE